MAHDYLQGVSCETMREGVRLCRVCSSQFHDDPGDVGAGGGGGRKGGGEKGEIIQVSFGGVSS